MNGDKFRKLVGDLIKAYEAIIIEKPDERIFFFGSYTREEVIQTAFYILKTELPRLSDLTEEEFEKLKPDENIEALKEVLNKPLEGTLPKDLEEMVEFLEKQPIGEATSKKIQENQNLQSPEARLRRMLNTLEVDDAIERVTTQETQANVIEAKHGDEIKKTLKDPQKAREFNQKLTEKIPEVQASQAYISYLNKSQPGQEIAAINVNTGLIAIPSEIYAITNRDRIIEEINRDENGFRERLLTDKTSKDLVNEYIQKVKQLKSDAPLPIINTDTQTIEEFPQENLAKLDSKSELIAIATANPTNDVPTIAAIKPIPQVPVEIPITMGGVWSIAPARAFVAYGINEIAKEDPATAASLKIIGHERDLVRAGVDPQVVEILVNRLKDVREKGGVPNWLATATATQGLPLTQQQLQIISSQSGGFTSYASYQAAFAPISTNIISATVNNMGQQFLGKFAAGRIEAGIRKGLAAAAEKAGGFVAKKIAGTALGQVASTLISIASKALAPLVGPLIDLGIRALGAFRKNFGRALTLGGAGALIGTLIAPGIGTLIGGMLGAIASDTDWKKIGQQALIILGLIFAAIFGAIAVPLAITFIGIPLLIVIILFIINSGAYIVPPGSPLGDLSGIFGTSGSAGTTITSPYIDVIKTATPPGPFQNGDGQLKTINYKVLVRAKKGALTNVKFQNTCQIIAKSNPYGRPTCTAPLPDQDKIPKVIDPGKTYEFDYSQDLSSFSDAFVVDTFTVTADASGQANAVAAASATIKIGNPPESCPSGWPVPEPIYISQGPQGTLSHIGYEAIDIPKPLGTLVRATHSGVITALVWTTSYGHNVRVNSTCGGKSFQTVYGHLDHILVSNGQLVNAGDVIGTVDNTGHSDGNHLHYEFRPILSGSNDGAVSPSNEPLLMGPPYIPRSVR